jgi:hypothetical protein
MAFQSETAIAGQVGYLHLSPSTADKSNTEKELNMTDNKTDTNTNSKTLVASIICGLSLLMVTLVGSPR